MSSDPIRQCPACGKRKVNRLIGTGAALIFKGSGFYATDYRSDSYKEGAKKESARSDKAAASPCDTCKSKKDSTPCPKAKPVSD
jgi:hypothetical protein